MLLYVRWRLFDVEAWFSLDLLVISSSCIKLTLPGRPTLPASCAFITKQTMIHRGQNQMETKLKYDSVDNLLEVFNFMCSVLLLYVFFALPTPPSRDPWTVEDWWSSVESAVGSPCNCISLEMYINDSFLTIKNCTYSLVAALCLCSHLKGFCLLWEENVSIQWKPACKG